MPVARLPGRMYEGPVSSGADCVDVHVHGKPMPGTRSASRLRRALRARRMRRILRALLLRGIVRRWLSRVTNRLEASNRICDRR